MRKEQVDKIIETSSGGLFEIGKPSPNFVGREKELQLVMECLCKKRTKGCILVGYPGVGKTEIVKKVASMMKSRRFLSMDCGALISGCMLQGMLEKRLNDVLHALTKYDEKQEITVFADEIHALFNLGRSSYNGGVSAADMLKPMLSEGKISIIGATTIDEYKQIVCKDKALLRRLPPIFISEMDDNQAKESVLAFCGDELSEDMVDKIMEKAKSLPYLSEPDRSIEIADRLMARMKLKKRIPRFSDIDEIIESMNMSEVFDNVG